MNKPASGRRLAKSVISSQSRRSAAGEHSLLATLKVWRNLVEATTVRSYKTCRRETASFRGVIRGQSKRSRTRARRAIAKVRDWSNTLFIGLTYPDQFPDDPKQWKNHLNELFRRAVNKFGNQLGMYWALHVTQRKSGVNAGRYVPHFHALLFNILPGKDKERLHKDFLSDKRFVKAAEHYERECRAQGLDIKLSWRSNWLHAFRLWQSINWSNIVKSDDTMHRKSGTYAQVPRQPLSCALYTVSAKADAEDNKSLYSQFSSGTGRTWGFRGKVDRSPAMEIQLDQEQMKEVSKYIRKYLKAKGGKAAQYAHKLKRGQSAYYRKYGQIHGFAVFGLGYASSRLWKTVDKATIIRMLKAVGAIE